MNFKYRLRGANVEAEAAKKLHQGASKQGNFLEDYSTGNQESIKNLNF